MAGSQSGLDGQRPPQLVASNCALWIVPAIRNVRLPGRGRCDDEALTLWRGVVGMVRTHPAPGDSWKS